MRPKIPLRWGILKKYGSVVALKLDTWYERLLRGPSPRFKSCPTPAKTILCIISNSQEFMYVCWSLTNVMASRILWHLFNCVAKLSPNCPKYVSKLPIVSQKLSQRCFNVAWGLMGSGRGRVNPQYITHILCPLPSVPALKQAVSW